MQERLDGVRTALHNWQTDPPAQDIYIRAHAQAVLADLERHGQLYEFFHDWFRAHPSVGSSYAVTKLLRAVQRQLYRNVPGYPVDFASPESWQEGFDWIFANHDRYGQFWVDTWVRPLQSNKSERYKSLKALGVIARSMGRLGVFNVLDVGCSQNAGLNHLASGIAFEPPTVIRPGSQHHRPSLEHTAAFSGLLSADVSLDLGVGVDLTYPEESRAWAWACSHYPSELLDEARVELFNALIMAEYTNVGFYKGDFADFNDTAFREAYTGQSFGIVNFSTVLYQADEQERQSMLDRAALYAEEFVVVQDFLKIDPNNPRELQFRDNWQDEPYPYRTVVRDMQEDSGHWHELFLWRDGRVRELTIGMGRLAIAPHRTASAWSVLDLKKHNYQRGNGF